LKKGSIRMKGQKRRNLHKKEGLKEEGEGREAEEEPRKKRGYSSIKRKKPGEKRGLQRVSLRAGRGGGGEKS
jgi:hypothetical protein